MQDKEESEKQHKQKIAHSVLRHVQNVSDHQHKEPPAHKDGQAATNESIFENLSADAWFPALYADDEVIPPMTPIDYSL